MLKTNKENLVKWSVQGKIHHPLGGNYRITFDGKPMVLPATGGISYNVKIGDSAFNWVGDHVEPGVSIRNENTTENAALTTFACIGNEAKVVSGDAKGKRLCNRDAWWYRTCYDLLWWRNFRRFSYRW